jgi:VWFA-related protein
MSIQGYWDRAPNPRSKMNGSDFWQLRNLRRQMNNAILSCGLSSRVEITRRASMAVILLLAFFSAAAWGQEQTQGQQQQQPQSQSSPQGQAQPQAGQQPPQSAQGKTTSESKAVSVLATVRDKHGKIMSNLTKVDFVLQEEGRPQTINYFAKESDLPLRLGLLVDTSLSQRRVLEEERSASYSFLDHLLRADKDLAFVIHFDREVELLEDFTPSRPKLQAALQSLQTPQFDTGGGGGRTGGGGGGGGGGGRGSHHGGGGGTLLYDAIYLASNELMSKQQGRKALIILSDGVDHGSKESLTTAIETAQRSDTVVYSILFKDDEGYGNPSGRMMGQHGGGHHGGGYPQGERTDGKKVLQQISKETGGRLFEVSKKETVEKIYADIDEELRNQYSLGYAPDKNAGPGYHKIQVATKEKDLVVQARDGYYGGQ